MKIKLRNLVPWHSASDKRTIKERGQGLVEMALIMPILVLMFIGMIEVGYAIWGHMTLQNVNREATRFAVKQAVLNFTEEDPLEMGYNNVVTHALESNASNLDFQFDGDELNSKIIITHISADTGKPMDCEDGDVDCFAQCNPESPDYDADYEDYFYDDLLLHPGVPGHEHYTYSYGELDFESRLLEEGYEFHARELKAENDAFNCRFLSVSPSYQPARASALIVESFYMQDQVVQFPVTTALFPDPVPLYARTTMRLDSEGDSCEVLPIALHIDTLNGWGPGEVRDIWNGGGQGDFGWLTWNPQEQNSPYLELEINEPRTSVNDFTDPTEPDDHVLNAGDWVAGLSGVNNDIDVRNAMEGIAGQTIIVPVWDQFNRGQGQEPSRYHISHFARVTVVETHLPQSGGYINAMLVESPVDSCASAPPDLW